jgi:hypothetical protein
VVLALVWAVDFFSAADTSVRSKARLEANHMYCTYPGTRVGLHKIGIIENGYAVAKSNFQT